MIDRPVIYFIRPSTVQGPIKVGFSIHFERRMADIGKWVPFPLEALAVFPVIGGNANWSVPKQCRLFESRFHQRYAPYRLHHEWFEPHDLLLADIEAIRDGTFDPRCLPNGDLPPEHIARFIQTERGLELEYSRFLTPERAKKERQREAA